MIISGLKIAEFVRQNAIDELKDGETNSQKRLKNAFKAEWEVADEEKFADLNAPFDFFLKECIKNEREQKRGER